MNFSAAHPVLETARLRLRPYALTDAPDLQRLAGDQAIAATTLNIPHPYPDGAAEVWIGTHAAKWAAQEELIFAITLRATGGLLGSAGLMIQAAHGQAELGYWIGVPYWNQGYATEAVRAVLDCGFLTLELSRIHAHHMTHNPASGRVMEKAGMRREGFSPQALKKDGRLVDAVFYGALRHEWPPLPSGRGGPALD